MLKMPIEELSQIAKAFAQSRIGMMVIAVYWRSDRGFSLSRGVFDGDRRQNVGFRVT
jgi:hypothetical protein